MRTEGGGNRVLRTLPGAKKNQVARVWRKLHGEEHYDLYCSPSIVWAIESRMSWVKYVALGFDRNLKEDGHFKDLCVCERMF
jgi:hypothetical protein